MGARMRNMNDPTGRVLQLLSLLQTHKAWSGVELAERLEVSPRTLRRDADRVRELGSPVASTTGAAGGYGLAAGAHMPPLLLDDEEAVVIAVGLRAAAGASVEGIEDTSLRALAKLEQVLPDHLRRRVTAIHGNVVSMRWGPDSPPHRLGLARRPVHGLPGPGAGRVRVRGPGRGRDPPPGRAPPARVHGPTLVPRGVGRPPGRLAHVPPRPADLTAARRGSLPGPSPPRRVRGCGGLRAA